MTASTRNREAALLIHSLPETAREQVLQRLTESERARVEPLMTELAHLGIPRLPSDRLAALRQAPLTVDRRERLGGVPAAVLLAALQDAGPVTLALLLRVEDWPWHADVLAGLDDQRKRRTEDLLRANAPMPVAAAVADHLCDRVLAKVDEFDAQRRTAPQVRPHRWTQWLPWTR